jgi:tetratricopeptide (TPR) repeat protein
MAEFKEAQKLKQEKKYAEALTQFNEIWDKAPDGGAGASIINCLRNLGKLDEAEKFFDKAFAMFPSSHWLKTEHVWTLYIKYIKPVETADKAVFLEKARQIMKLTTDLLPRKLTAFKVTDILAKEPDPDWAEIRRWLESIREVETERAEADPGKRLSDKKKWYFKYTKALLKQGEYGFCRQYCMRAQSMFKNVYFFAHRAAKCIKALGDLNGAYAEFEVLLGVHDEWYVHLDFAELLLMLGDTERAENHAVQAVTKCTNIQLRSRTLMMWSNIMERTSPANAWLPLYVFLQYRMENGWPLPEELTQCIKRNKCPADAKHSTYKELDARMAILANERFAQFKPDKRGTIKNLRDKFGFIHGDDNQDIFFSLINYTGPKPLVGMRVTYRIKRAFDRKKKRVSPEGVDVQGTPTRQLGRGFRPGTRYY